MKIAVLSNRTVKEIIRDPLNIFFGIAFPLIIFYLLYLINQNIPAEIYNISELTPGIIIFGLSFMTLFSATILAKDRESAFLERLYTAPLSVLDFLLSYALPILMLSLVQSIIICLTAVFFGMPITENFFLALLCQIPVSLLFIFLGLLCGSVFNVKQVGGLCGAVLVNLTAWFSGIWFDLSLLGEGFKNFAYYLPFVHSVELLKDAFSNNIEGLFSNMLWILFYMSLVLLLAFILFLKQMKR